MLDGVECPDSFHDITTAMFPRTSSGVTSFHPSYALNLLATIILDMAAFTKITVAALFVNVVRADPPWGGGGGGAWGGNGNRWGSGGRNDNDGDSNTSYGTEENGFGFGDMASFDRANTILIAHAVIASAVWVLFVPWAALLLRLNIKSPIV